MFANLLGEVKGKVVDFITRKCKRNFVLSIFELPNYLEPKALGYRTYKYLSTITFVCHVSILFNIFFYEAY